MNDMYEVTLQVEDPCTLIAAPEVLANAWEAHIEREMIALHQNIETLLPAVEKKVIQFIGSRTGEGVSTIVREYARMATTTLEKSVLIIDAGQGSGGQRRYFDIKNSHGWDDAVREQITVGSATTRIGESSLFVSCVSFPPTAKSQIFNPGRMAYFFNKIRPCFDLVLVDSPSAATGIDTSAVTRCANGVILVVEAERTRWPVVEKAKNRIQKNGGNILGMVFNKRQHYIPEFLYRRL